MSATPGQAAEDVRIEQGRYRALVRSRDPATMEKRRLASLCPVCGEHLIDGAHG